MRAYEGLCNIIQSHRRSGDVVPIETLQVLKRDCDLEKDQEDDRASRLAEEALALLRQSIVVIEGNTRESRQFIQDVEFFLGQFREKE
jgi:hypothetical protein